MKKLLLLTAGFLSLAGAARAQDLTPMPGDMPQQPVTFLSQPLSMPPAGTVSVPDKDDMALHEIPRETSGDTLKEFRVLDRNNDGVITFEEFAARYGRVYPPTDDPTDLGDQFAVMDADKDGVVTLKEFQTGFKAPIDQNYTMKWVPNGAHSPND